MVLQHSLLILENIGSNRRLSTEDHWDPSTPLLQKPIQDIKEVGTYIDQLLDPGNSFEGRYQSEDIVVIFDVDGTLTNHSNVPAPWPIPYPERPGAVKLVQRLEQLKVSMIASSAHFPFHETVQKLQLLNLGDPFRATSLVTHFKMETLSAKEIQSGLSHSFDVYHLGKVVLVASTGVNFYTRKALSPLIPFNKLERNHFKRLIFVDDNSNMINRFKSDILQYDAVGIGLEKVDYFELSFVP